MTPTRPALVLIGVPGLPEGIFTARCDRCNNRYPVQESTARLLAGAAPADRPLVVCHGCYTTEPVPTARDLVVGLDEGRRRLGLDA